MLSLEIKDFNALIGNKPFLYQPVKYKQRAFEKLVEMSRNNFYTKGTYCIDYLYHQNYYKLIGMDFFKTNKYNYSSIN